MQGGYKGVQEVGFVWKLEMKIQFEKKNALRLCGKSAEICSDVPDRVFVLMHFVLIW